MTFILHLCILLATNLVLVTGLGLVVGVAGIVALNAGAFAAIGAYTYAIATTSFHFDPVVAACLALTAGLIVGWPIARTLAPLDGEDLVLGTLAVQLVVSSLVSNVDSLTGGIYGLPNIPRLGGGLAPGSLLGTGLATFGITVLALLALGRLYRSPFARLLRGSRDAPTDTLLLGCDLRVLRRRALLCAAVSGAVAGVLMASYLTYIDPSLVDLNVSISVLAAVIVGGAGRFTGALLGASVVTLLPEALRFLPVTSGAAPAIQQVVFGVVLVACMLRRPSGLLGEYGFERAT